MGLAKQVSPGGRGVQMTPPPIHMNITPHPALLGMTRGPEDPLLAIHLLRPRHVHLCNHLWAARGLQALCPSPLQTSPPPIRARFS